MTEWPVMRSGLFVAFLSAGALFTAVGAVADTQPKLRLGEVEQAHPENYKVDLTLDPNREDFDGVIDIRVNIEHALPILWLNATDINVKSASVSSGRVRQTAAVIPGGDDFLGLKLADTLPPGPADVHIEYTGKFLLKQQAGIFRTEDGGNRYLLTQFEQTDARRAFPCFDEPLYKVPWQITLHVPAQDSAVSNTPIVNQHADGATKTYIFEQTKPLPSYLVAFGVGPFEYVDAGFAGKNHVPVHIVTPKGRADEAKYAAEVTATILTRLEDYFGVPYPYPKCDQVAIPISAGFAMENAAMVTYGQTIILAKPSSDTEKRRREYASVAAHELAHQWFGDLVTTSWWNDIWLNEAFASWMSSKLIAEWKPEWGSRSDDVSQKLYAENQDSLLTARKITQEIESKGDIENAFDSITYLKGDAVIGMFENWIGPDDFRDGVQRYMKRFAYRTATTGDFLDSISSASKKDVTTAFSTFLNQSGVPIVSVALHCGQNGATLHLAQQRYLPLGSKPTHDQIWDIPVCVRYGGPAADQSACTLMTAKEIDFPLTTKACPAWINANDKAVGYYRIRYEDGLLQKLVDGNVTKRLDPAERVDLIGDIRALGLSGQMPMADALALVSVVHTDPDRHVIEEAANLALTPSAHLVSADLEPKYAEFIRSSFATRAGELGWSPKQGEPDNDTLLRPQLVPAVAQQGKDSQLAQEGRKQANMWLDTQKGIDPNMLASVLNTAAYYGDGSLAERFIATWGKLDPHQQDSVLNAMFRFRDPKAIETLFNALLSGQLPSTPCGYLLFYAGADSPEARNVRFDFLQAHYDAVLKLYGDDPFVGKARLPIVGTGFCDSEAKIRLASFFTPKLDQLTGAKRTLAQVLEGIDQCMSVREAQELSVRSFLEGHQWTH